MTRNRELTTLLGGATNPTCSLEGGRISIVLPNGNDLSFNTSRSDAPTLMGSVDAVLDDDATLRLVMLEDDVRTPIDFPLTSNPAVLVRDRAGTIVYAD
jgi:hypothetical protein